MRYAEDATEDEVAAGGAEVERIKEAGEESDKESDRLFDIERR